MPETANSIRSINHVSDNVGCVKYFSNTLWHALEEERHFALSEKVPYPSLTMSAVSSTFRTHFRMHSKKSVISLYQKKCHTQPRLASQSLSSGTRSDPSDSSVRYT